MVENHPEVEAWSCRGKHFASGDGGHPVGFEGEVQELAGDEVAADEGGEGAEALFVEDGVVFRCPVAAGAVE